MVASRRGTEVEPRATYRIAVRGRLGRRFASAFVGTTMEAEGSDTRLVTEPFDERQLRDLLDHLADLGLDVLAVDEGER